MLTATAYHIFLILISKKLMKWGQCDWYWGWPPIL